MSKRTIVIEIDAEAEVCGKCRHGSAGWCWLFVEATPYFHDSYGLPRNLRLPACWTAEGEARSAAAKAAP